MKGIRWIPIYKKAMEIHAELERTNQHDFYYKNSLGDILYLGLGFLQMMMDDEPPESLTKLILEIREEYISSQEDNLQFMRVFGQMENDFEDRLEESRMMKKMGNWKPIHKKEDLDGVLLKKYDEVKDLISQEDFFSRLSDYNNSDIGEIALADILIKDLKKGGDLNGF